MLLQVWEQDFDFKLLTCKFFRGQIIVAHVARYSFLRDVLLVGVKSRSEESRTAVQQCVYHSSKFIFNTNKRALFNY